jgi:hypothetical protein
VYLFAHRVLSTSGRGGINGGLYVHDGSAFPADLWLRDPATTVKLVTARYPGCRVRDRVDVAPGGNSVESWLDVVGPDETTRQEVSESLGGLSGLVARDGAGPHVHRRGRVTVAFGCNLGIEQPSQALAELTEAALQLREAPPAPWTEVPPLRVVLEHDGEGTRFVLDPPSAARVIHAGGSPTPIRIGHDVAADFRALHGPLYPHLPQLLTALPSEQVLELGGVSIEDAGQTVFEWPARP